MAEHNNFGKEAEIKAREFLLSSGYKILETNWRFHRAEIDIIAQKDQELIIVEVKARSSNYLSSPEESVNENKRKLLISAANAYVLNRNLDMEVRFDIISIVKQKGQWNLTHIEDAFNAIL